MDPDKFISNNLLASPSFTAVLHSQQAALFHSYLAVANPGIFAEWQMTLNAGSNLCSSPSLMEKLTMKYYHTLQVREARLYSNPAIQSLELSAEAATESPDDVSGDMLMGLLPQLEQYSETTIASVAASLLHEVQEASNPTGEQSHLLAQRSTPTV